MNLRQELTPSSVDERLLARLAELANAPDGNRSETLRAEFNKLAGTQVPMIVFQGVCESEDHTNFVRRVLHEQRIKPVSDVTREELVEIVRRAMKPDKESIGLSIRPLLINKLFKTNVGNGSVAACRDSL